jgi:hypothetical protein
MVQLSQREIEEKERRDKDWEQRQKQPIKPPDKPQQVIIKTIEQPVKTIKTPKITHSKAGRPKKYNKTMIIYKRRIPEEDKQSIDNLIGNYLNNKYNV